MSGLCARTSLSSRSRALVALSPPLPALINLGFGSVDFISSKSCLFTAVGIPRSVVESPNMTTTGLAGGGMIASDLLILFSEASVGVAARASN